MESRSAAIADIKSKSDKIAVRGNVVWATKSKQLFFYYISLKDKKWSYECYTENENPPVLSCPKKFLNECDIDINPEWRELLINRLNKNSNKRNEIMEAFNNKKEDEILKVFLKPKEGFSIWSKAGWHSPAKKMELIVEKTISGVIGRCETDDRLYHVPIRLIDRFEVIKDEYWD